MSEVGCISEAELRAFVVGELPERIVRLITRHLEGCPACEAAARRLDLLADPFLRSLRLAIRPSSPSSCTDWSVHNSAADALSSDSVADQIQIETISGAARPGSKAASSPLPALPGYVMLAELGRGGMGVVYRARQVRLQREVAVKMLLNGQHASAERRVRFRAEADAIARLHHPAILQVYDIGEHDGIPFLVLEYMNGGSLERRLAGKPVPPRQAADLLETVARAVDYAHGQGVIHRDLKPSNILLGDERRVTSGGQQSPADALLASASLATPKIADFGLAKQHCADLTSVGDLLGTPSYMAPEQAAGDASKIGPAVDIYALGAILYESLTGRPPFMSACSLETLEQVRTREPVAPTRLANGIPRDLETICLKCLEKEPERRYQTAQLLADDLRHFLDGRPVVARPTGVCGRAWRWTRRNPSWSAMIASLAGLLLISAFGATALSVWALRAERQTQEKLVQSKISEARAVSLGRRPGQRFKSLALLDEAGQLANRLPRAPARLDEIRNGVVAALAMPDLYPAPERYRLPDHVHYVAVDDGLTIAACTDANGGCTVRRLADGSEILSLPGSTGIGQENWPFLSRDGRFLAVRRSDGGLQVWQLDSDSPRKLLTEDKVRWVDFHPTLAQVGFVQENGAIVLHDLVSDAQFRLPPDELSREVAIALHPTEPFVAVGSYLARVVKVRNYRTGALVQTLNLGDATAFHVAWHPDGHTLAVSSSDAIRLFDRDTFMCRLTFAAAGGGGERLYFNHSGDRLASYGWNSAVHLYDAASGKLLCTASNARSIIGLRFSKDDRLLAGFLEGNQLGFWQVGDGREYRTLARQAGARGGAYLGASVSVDNQLLAVCMSDGVALWDLASGNELEFLPLKRACFVQFEPAPDAALLIGDAGGTFRWPVRRDPAPPDCVRIGPPEALPLPAGSAPARSQDGRVIATACRAVGTFEPWAGAWVLRPDHPDKPLHLAAGADFWNISVSPDGRWLVTGSASSGAVRLWDAATGALARTLTNEGSSPQFSPDGQWLVEGGKPGRLLRVGDWQETATLGNAARFSPDSSMLAVWTKTAAIRLVETASGRERARLEGPDFEIPHDICFTPDGSRLIVVNLKKGIQIWDLRLVREALSQRHLDWDAPPSALPSPRAELRRAEWQRGDYERIRDQRESANYDLAVHAAPTLAQRWYLRGLYRQAAALPERAAEDFRKALELQPGTAHFANSLAWALCTSPEPSDHAEEAVKVARVATERRPGEWSYHNTLGIALYRAGRVNEAVTELNTSLNSSAGQSDAFDLYFLAMASYRLDEPVAAQEHYARAAAWHRAQKNLPPDQVRELDAFAAEAASVLGLAQTPASSK